MIIDPTLVDYMIESAATKIGVDPKLLRAVCMVESAMKINAIRFEHDYKWTFEPERFAKKLGITVETEIACQSFSYGLGQVMGAVCREYGFEGHLFDLVQNRSDMALAYAAKHLAAKLKKAERTEDAIAAYNAGSVRRVSSGDYVNQGYVDKVLKALREIG